MPSRLQRLVTAALGGVLGLGLLATTAVADPAPAAVNRVEGANRFATAAAVSAAKAQPHAPVYVANGMAFPDALAGAPAAAQADGVILLVERDHLQAEVAAELERLEPTTIHVLGGQLAVGDDVAAQLARYGQVVRHHGVDRYATAAAISASAFTPKVPVAYVASGLDYPDALAGAAVAGRDGAPVLLTDPAALPGSVTAELTRLRPGRIVVLGGPTAVSRGVEAALGASTTGGVTRLAGHDRYATAAAITSASFTAAGQVYLASGRSFADALAGAVVAARGGAPLLLVEPDAVPPAVAAELARLAPRALTVLGGPKAIGPDVERAVARGGATPPQDGPAAPPTEPPSVRPTTAQWRGLWVDGFHAGFFTPAEVSRLVADATALGANALVVQVGRRFDCFCNEALYPRTDAAVALAPFDPLAEVVAQAHAAGIEVHAWVNATTLWNSATAPTSPEHAFNTHGPSAHGDNRWLNKRYDGVELVGNNAFLDPANPDAVDYVVDAVSSITENYDVDGVSLDYIRYPDYNSAQFVNDWGYSETSLARFAAETGRTDRPAPDDPEFSDWRRAQVTGLVERVYDRMSEVDATDRLSVNAVTYGNGPSALGGWERTRPYTEVLQDWRGWLADGIVDQVSAMNYKRDHDPAQAQMFTEWNQALAAYRAGRHVVSGPALYLNTVEASVRQAEEVSRLGLDGWQGYSYASASAEATASPSAAVKAAERDRLFAALRAGVLAGDADVPAMTWK